MIRRLKMKFVTLAMAGIFALLLVIVTGMNLLNYQSVVREADTILEILSTNKGDFPEFRGEGRGTLWPRNMSPETPYESRYFSVLADADGNVVNAELSRIATVSEENAAKYAQIALDRNDSEGFVEDYRYVRYSEGTGYRIVFLDCGRNLDVFYNFLKTSVGMSLGGFAVVFVVIFVLSGKIIQPIAESYEKQKRFITDAGHEIKTPLTIINANLDILEMELGENESLSDIAQQTQRLRSLTNDLVMLARMEESEEKMQKIEFPISEIVTDAVQPFRALAAQQEKELICDIQPMLTLKGNDDAIQKLVIILMDNALKYSPAGEAVTISMKKQNRMLQISVFNKVEGEIRQEQLDHVFDRFYRMDASRNSETGGHGIGLSIAQAIVAAHGGKISARTQDGKSFQLLVTFPV